MIRYAVIAQHDGLRAEQFDFKTHKDRMINWMDSLLRQYTRVRRMNNIDDVVKDSLLKNEVEMICYQIIGIATDSIGLHHLFQGENLQNYDLSVYPLLKEAA